MLIIEINNFIFNFFKYAQAHILMKFESVFPAALI